MSDRWLNQSLDGITRKTLATLGSRLLVGVSAALLAVYCLGWSIAAVWMTANVIAELATWFASGPQRRGAQQTNRQRVRYLVAIVWMNAVWASLAILFWQSGDAALRLCALALLACQMLHASIFNAQSNALLAIVGGTPAVTLVVLSALAVAGSGRFGPVFAVTAILMTAYIAHAAFVNRRNVQAVEASQAAALAANRAKSEFLALMSHELRTPMTGVMGMAHALAAHPLPAAQQRQVEVLISSGETLLTLLNDILDLSKIEAGKLELECAPFDPAASACRVRDLWRDAAEAKGLTLECATDAEDELWIAGDDTRYQQIISNLVGNALKFTESGGVKIALSAQRTPNGDAELRLSVSDSGIGMSDEQMARLFHPFSQGDASVMRRFGGTGLGLSICRQLAAAMGGEITVSSRPDAGATFTLRLCAPVAAPPQPAVILAATSDRDLQGLRVLFVDDNEVNRLVGSTLLQPFGCVVDVAEDGVIAIERLAHFAADIVLLDIHMPRLGGVETLAAIRAQRLVADEAPIIALTADVLPDQVARLLAAGFDGVEAKPINPLRLIACIAAALAARSASSGPVQTLKAS
jgi:signal transduction histidine kinase/AmiR/NasT family two-component response regulator